MKKVIFLIAFFVFISGFCYNITFSQIDDFIKNTVELPELYEEKTITTSLSDAYPVVFWLGELECETPNSVTSRENMYGYFRDTIQTYCLKAGNYSPTQGAGYLIAPLKGLRAGIVQKILQRSVQHPEIAQRDIQVLLWGILYKTKFTDFSTDFQLRVKPLLTDAEIIELSTVPEEIAFDLLPDEVKKQLNFYGDLRKRLTNPSSNYRDIEDFAIRQGVPGSELNKKNIQPGNWALIKNGFYIRVYPWSYPTTQIDIYRPPKVNAVKDDKGRFISLEEGGYKIEITYNDEPGADIYSSAGKPDMPIWRFKTLKFSGPNAGEELIVQDKGWIVRGNGKPIGKGGSPVIINKLLDEPKDFSDYLEMVNGTEETRQKLEQWIKYRGAPPLTKEEKAEFNASSHMHDGLKAAFDPLDREGRQEWIEKTARVNRTWWQGVLTWLRCGGSSDGEFDPTGEVGAPGNTGYQRLAISNRDIDR